MFLQKNLLQGCTVGGDLTPRSGLAFASDSEQNASLIVKHVQPPKFQEARDVFPAISALSRRFRVISGISRFFLVFSGF